MKKISSTPIVNNNNYSHKKSTVKVSKPIDALEFKRILAEEKAKISAANNSKLEQFKSLVSTAEAKLTSQLTTAPLKDEIYNAEVNKMMSESNIAKMRVKQKSIEELRKSTNAESMQVPYVPVKSKNDSEYNGYKRNYGYSKKSYNDYDDIEVQNNTSTFNSIEKVPEKKPSFWQKFKTAIKNFFNGNQQSSSPDAIKSKTDSNFKENIKVSSNNYPSWQDPNAPQIDKNEMEKRRLRNYREMALANEHPAKLKEDGYAK